MYGILYAGKTGSIGAVDPKEKNNKMRDPSIAPPQANSKKQVQNNSAAHCSGVLPVLIAAAYV